jgi:hypothetical protein
VNGAHGPAACEARSRAENIVDTDDPSRDEGATDHYFPDKYD